MNLRNIKQILLNMPFFINEPLFILNNNIPFIDFFGKKYLNMFSFLLESQWWDEKKLREYNLRKLNEMIKFCSMHVPFYQKHWADYGINIKSEIDFSDFAKLPYTTKSDIRAFGNQLIPNIFDVKNLLTMRTGGTTGSPANFYCIPEAHMNELCFLFFTGRGMDVIFSKIKLHFFEVLLIKQQKLRE